VISDPRAALEAAATVLSAERTAIRVRFCAPQPPSDEISAAGGFGLTTDGHDVRVSVYAFSHWGEGQEHAVDAEAAASATERIAVVAVNGPLLFVGTAPSGDLPALFVLNDLCSAFAGRE
jgi:hypothetical protein